MSRQDIDRWQHKYAAPANKVLTPDPLLAEYASLLRGPGVALDLACGRGRNSLFLARLGKTVYAVDGSLLAARSLQRLAHNNIHVWVTDLEHWQCPAAIFDLVVVDYFLYRPLIPVLITALKPGGLLFYQTFNKNILQQRPGFSPDYLLTPGELMQTATGMKILASNDTPENTDSSSFVLAKKAPLVDHQVVRK